MYLNRVGGKRKFSSYSICFGTSEKCFALSQKLLIFVTRNNDMQNTVQNIEETIKSFGRGKIFFADDFLGAGTPEAIRQTLLRLSKAGEIIRVAQGIYCYPEIDTRLGLGTIRPSYEQIAKALAERTHARIVPTGEYALNVLGLSTQVPMNFVYLTDGTSRRIDISEGRGITFKKTAPKNLAFRNRLAMLVTSALKSIKKENVTEEQIKHIETLLQQEDKESVLADLKLMPVWIRKIVLNAYE